MADEIGEEKRSRKEKSPNQATAAKETTPWCSWGESTEWPKSRDSRRCVSVRSTRRLEAIALAGCYCTAVARLLLPDQRWCDRRSWPFFCCRTVRPAIASGTSATALPMSPPRRRPALIAVTGPLDLCWVAVSAEEAYGEREEEKCFDSSSSNSSNSSSSSSSGDGDGSQEGHRPRYLFVLLPSVGSREDSSLLGFPRGCCFRGPEPLVNAGCF